LPRSLLLLALWACSGAEPEPPSCEDATWEAVAQPFLTTWCTPCHASTVSEEDRRGAPVGMDFETWEVAHLFADAIARRSNNDAALMPPGGGTTLVEREQIARWAECGAPGPATPLDPCAERIEFAGDATSAGEPCAAGANVVTGSVLLEGPLASEGALDCLCEIDQDLQIGGGLSALTLPRLQRVGGAIEASSPVLRTLALPELEAAGELRLANVALEALDIEHLVQVDGLFLVTGGRLPPLFAPPRLALVGSHFGLSGVAGIELIELPRLERVGGNLVIEQLPALGAIIHTSDLETVEGSLRIIDNPSLSAIEDFGFVVNVFGDVELGGGHATYIDALWGLKRIDGDLILRDEPELQRIEGFVELELVTGNIRMTGLGASSVEGFDLLEEVGGFELADNPQLASWVGGAPLSVLGEVRVANNPQLPTLPLLSQVQTLTGSVELTDLPALLSLGELSLAELGGSLHLARNPALLDLGNTALQIIHGDLLLEDHPALISITGLSQLHTVEGDLLLRGAPLLPVDQIELLQESVTVGGSTTLEP
jgi:hypothetical protein